MQSPLLKSTLWLSSGMMLHFVAAPPHPRVSKYDCSARDEGWLANLTIRYERKIYSALTWYITLYEVFAVQSTPLRRITIFPNLYDERVVEASFLASWAFIAVFFLLRAYSSQLLGDLYAPVVAIRPGRGLVDSGSYGLVRHPSYTAFYGVAFGNMMLHLSVVDAWGVKWAVCVWALLVAISCSQIPLRVDREDRMLSKVFGAEWKAYREKVPWLFVPGFM